MPRSAPKIDPRTYDDLVEQTTALAKIHSPDWRPAAGKRDVGQALIAIFARMAEQVIERLNQAPENNFRAFLNLIGTQIRPPRPARVPLTFRLAPGSSSDAVVRARTQVGAPPDAGETADIVFETEQELTVSRTQLAAAYVHQPQGDTYSEVTAIATGSDTTNFAAFQGTTTVEHSLYLACDELFSQPETRSVTLTLTVLNQAQPPSVVWEYWDGASWKPEPTISSHLHNNEWSITFAQFLTSSQLSLNGIEARWIRSRLTQPTVNNTSVTLGQITAAAHLDYPKTVPATAFFNSIPLDLSKDFFPFGEQPRLTDSFYLALPAVIAKPGATVTISTMLTSDPRPTGDLVVAWEVWDGNTWTTIRASTGPTGDAVNFTTSGQITFQLPAQLSERVINGERGYWLRARIAKGNYGTAPTPQVTTTHSTGQMPGGQPQLTEIKVTMIGGFAPPILSSLTLDAAVTYPATPVTNCLTYDDLTFHDRSDEARSGTGTFTAFSKTTDTDPALYLGFDRSFGNQPVTLYFQVVPPDPGEVARTLATQFEPLSSPHLIWEYATTAGWHTLGVEDNTNAFAESGLVRFVGPADFSHRVQFGHGLYWLRVRWASGMFVIPPRIQRVLTNTTWASQTTTLVNEILGSTTGEPQQTFRTVQTPVLLGQQLEVREAEIPSPAEQETLFAIEGADAVTVTRNEAGQVADVWVRWHAVPDFYTSGPRDRHYVIDHLTGEIRFGDGTHGRIPPLGRQNIRMAVYRTSGGAKGNRPAQTITRLKSSVPHVASVSNLFPAEGGADQETLESVQERGPKTLRHRGRAVTAQDIEDLAFEASSDVARARALMSDFDPINHDGLPTFAFTLTRPGEIRISVTEAEQPLLVVLHGPGRSTSYASQTGTDNFTLSYWVAPDLAQGDRWQVTLVNHGQTNISCVVQITHPEGAVDTQVDVPPLSDYTPGGTMRSAGQVELIIVPRSHDRQPTPSLNLISQVREYLRARCTPTLLLQVTEPEWVEVTIRATVIPTSLEVAAQLPALVTLTLERFLHPLTGGFAGQGWPFGRRPHLSDLYACLEHIPEVDRVQSLSVRNTPSLKDLDPVQPGETPEEEGGVAVLPREKRNRFLIYSGIHTVTVESPDTTSLKVRS